MAISKLNALKVGESDPIETLTKCGNPEYENPNIHNVGWFAACIDPYGFPSHRLVKRCINCGQYLHGLTDHDFQSTRSLPVIDDQEDDLLLVGGY